MITATANSLIWLGLTVLNTEGGKSEDETGIVEFIAVYQEGKSRILLRKKVNGFTLMERFYHPFNQKKMNLVGATVAKSLNSVTENLSKLGRI